jgi:hypothetical protein
MLEHKEVEKLVVSHPAPEVAEVGAPKHRAGSGAVGPQLAHPHHFRRHQSRQLPPGQHRATAGDFLADQRKPVHGPRLEDQQFEQDG